jgi:hypothetical protein
VSVETETGGSGVRLAHGCGAAWIAYSHGHQSHQAGPGDVALLAPLADAIGVAVMRSFTGGGCSIEPASDGIRPAALIQRYGRYRDAGIASGWAIP